MTLTSAPTGRRRKVPRGRLQTRLPKNGLKVVSPSDSVTRVTIADCFHVAAQPAYPVAAHHQYAHSARV
jgi:hypothetical protein